MYDLAKAVGPNKPNLPDDVKLITTLFSTTQSFNDFLMEDVPKVPVGGVFTPVLAQAIVKFQQNLRKANGRNVVDGIIDPLPSQSGTQGDWDTTFRNGVRSTLATLCYRLFRMNRDTYAKIGDNLNLPWEPDPFDMSS